MRLPDDGNTIPDKLYVYLGNFNIINKNVLINYQEKAIEKVEYVGSGAILVNRSRIYNVGSAEVYYR